MCSGFLVYNIFKLFISCCVKCLQLPLGRFFLVKPENSTRSSFLTL